MHRFYLAPNDWSSAALTGTEAHHARGVLRLQPGDRVVLFDGQGREATAEITALDSAAVRLHILQEAVTPPLRPASPLPRPYRRGKTWISSCRNRSRSARRRSFPSFPRAPWCILTPSSAAQKRAKWQTVALEAAKQCGQNWLPHIHFPRSPDDFFREIESAISPVGAEAGMSSADSRTAAVRPAARRLAPAGRAAFEKDPGRLRRDLRRDAASERPHADRTGRRFHAG